MSLAGCGGSDSGGGGNKDASGQKQQLDPTQGKRGGKLIIQAYGDPGAGLELWKIRNPGVHQMAGFTHDGLLEHRNGTPAFDGGDIYPQPNLAQAMPEQPDPQTGEFWATSKGRTVEIVARDTAGGFDDIGDYSTVDVVAYRFLGAAVIHLRAVDSLTNWRKVEFQ